MYSSGLRSSEVRALTVDNITRRGDRLQLTVTGKGGKTRTVVLGPKCSKVLARFINSTGGGEGDRIVFTSNRGKAMAASSLGRIVTSVAKRAKVKARVTPHTLRHCYATHCIEGGVPLHVVQRDLGHASITTTQIYLHANPETTGSDAVDGVGR